ncbi:MAG: excinuclease ABC subunit UvrA [Paludibacteraceae bacterium]|nr:excinuclease ABC subunit UvrA [Paludibacteraceae bacterium]
MKSEEYIEVTGARVHNLKNIDVRIPRGELTVITGLSGSGKSSLAFDTIFAEGQRRYMDTFSSYARGYIGQMQRPDVDRITGLSPVISVDQKTTGKNPRSTVGTVTEVYDFLRLLYARAGGAYSYATGEKMVKYTDEQIIDLIIKEYAGERIYIIAQLVNNRKGHYKELFETWRKKGFVYVRIDGEVQELVQGMKVDRYKNHTIDLVVDRLEIGPADGLQEDDLRRLRQSVDKAMTIGGGMIGIVKDNTVRFFSRNLMDPESGISYREPAPHSFSFNSPSGWCPCCKGLGKVKIGDVNELIDEVIRGDNWWEELQQLANKPFSAEAAPSASTEGRSGWEKLQEVTSEGVNELTEEEEEEKNEWQECPECHGLRLNKEALSYRIAGKNIAELSAMDISELKAFLSGLSDESDESDGSENILSAKQRAIAEPILKEIITRLDFMLSVGLGYLSIGRPAESLSGGESQRIRLATQIGSRLVNVLYILDEPSIGLHQRDNQRLINSLKQLRDMGNSVIVVEHDEQIMREADYIVDIGPKAGRLGGEVLFQGTPKEMLKSGTLTAQYLNNPNSLTGRTDQTNQGELILRGCRGNNLRNIDVSFPLGKMIGVTGVSGSGKSTLVNKTLYPILSQYFYRSLTPPMPYDSIEGLELIDKVIAVDQSPIGRTPRSNPATYTNVFNDIRDLFAALPEAQIRGWKAGRFSFNTKGGRCEECAGNGYKTIRMHFLPDVFVPCEACGGQRYNRETLEVRFKGKTIADVLDMTVNQAVEFFESQPYILRKIKTIQEVGLGYIKLGQSSTTLSGGESQRIKLATELSRPSTGKTVYILDEPTTGLHFDDIRVLMGVLRQLTDRGNTVIIIEHNLDVIRACDHIIDLGPEGGRAGGEVVATGSVEDIKKNKNSLTGQYL